MTAMIAPRMCAGLQGVCTHLDTNQHALEECVVIARVNLAAGTENVVVRVRLAMRVKSAGVQNVRLAVEQVNLVVREGVAQPLIWHVLVVFVTLAESATKYAVLVGIAVVFNWTVSLKVE